MAKKSSKTRQGHGRIVGVITTPDELRRAARMSAPPDFFELRLDCLIGLEDEIEKTMPRLRAPIIITARHPREGGAHNLSIRRRRQLLLRFLQRARYIDVELRSAKKLNAVLELARKNKVRLILSFHDFRTTPTAGTLQARARRAKSLGADIFKIATRTDSPAQLGRLLEFITKHDSRLGISAMGMGKLGAASRLALARCGSLLVYASIGEARIEGQPSLAQLRPFSAHREESRDGKALSFAVWPRRLS
jgi:3-dehydroquinate dehydratase I